MGFFNDLGNALMGTGSRPAAGGQSTGEQGHKVISDMELKNIRSHRNGSQLAVTAWVTNNSDQRIRVDTCAMLKQKQTFNRELDPGQSHELILYQGETPHDENDHQVQITYRLHANGDLFQENYRIDFHLESDGARTISNLYSDGPVRDI